MSYLLLFTLVHVGIPKTIDNDVDLIDRSFGFLTSVEVAQQAILAAKVCVGSIFVMLYVCAEMTPI